MGILSVWPFLYLILFLSMMVFTFASFGAAGTGKPPGHTFDLFKYIFPLHIATMLLMFGLSAAYVIHAFRTDEIESDKRVLWVMVLFLGNMIAFPIYWWYFVRPSRERQSPSVESIPPQ
jgi:hypothetical protein